MGTVLTLAGWALALLSGWVAVSCLVRTAIARFTRGHSVTVPDCGLLLPELSGAACLAGLALLGVHPLLAGLGSAVLLAVALLPLANAVRRSRKLEAGKAAAVRLRVRSALLLMLRTAWAVPAWDVRALLGLLRGGTLAAAGAPPAVSPAVPFTAPPGHLLNTLRSVPSVLGDPGGVPAPAEVAVDLEAFGAAVPPPWQALADYIAEFEPADQDELEEHMAGDAAGLLTVAEAAGARAEAVLSIRKLHPAIAAALVEIADALADVAPLYPLAMRRYHDEYEAVEDHHEAGGTLPEDARTWFAGGGAPAA